MALRKEWFKEANCNECSITFRPVPSLGAKKPKVICIGKVVDSNEAAKRKTGAGPAGQLLRKILLTLGLNTATDVYFMNALPCRVLRDKSPTWDDMQCCRPKFLAELKSMLQPDTIIIALGAVANQMLLNQKAKYTITKNRGRFYEWEGFQVMPAIHPAAIMRGTGTKKQLKDDLKKVITLVNGGKLKTHPEPTYEIVTPKAAQKAIALIHKQKFVAGDLETTGFSFLDDRILALGVAISASKVLIFPDTTLEKLDPIWLEKLFGKKSTRWAWWNGKFDIKFLWHCMGKRIARVDHDGMLASYALNELPGYHDLEQRAVDDLNIEPYEHFVKGLLGKDDTYEVIPRDILYTYLAKDCVYTYSLTKKYYRRIRKNPKLTELYHNLLIPASKQLARVESNGIPIDETAIWALKEYLEQEKKLSLARVQEMAVQYRLTEYNPGSPKQAVDLFFTRMRLQVPRKHKKSAQRPLLEKVRANLRDSDPRAKLMDEHFYYKELQKDLGTYTIGIINVTHSDGYVHMTFLLHGTVTGRLSSRKPNTQNLPRASSERGLRIRLCFVAPKGKCFISSDYGQAELRDLAVRSGDAFLRKVYLDGRDLHGEVQADFIAKGVVSKPRSADEAQELRVKVKMVNFGIVYGRNGSSIAKEYGMPKAEGEKLVAAWLRNMTGVKKFMSEVSRVGRTGGTLISHFGRHRRFHNQPRNSWYQINEAENQAKNFLIQSESSDCTLFSAMLLQREIDKRELDAAIVNLVHDDITSAVDYNPATILEYTILTLRTMKKTAERKLETDIPFEADAKIGFNFGKMIALPELKELEKMSVEDMKQWLGKHLKRKVRKRKRVL